jgi:hypothetical protein
LRWILDKALKVSFLKDIGKFVLLWLRRGDHFNKDWMATWDLPARGSHSIAIALNFAVQEDTTAGQEDYNARDEAGEDETDESRGCTRWPATVVMQNRRKRAKPTSIDLSDQIGKLKHLTTSTQEQWYPIRASALLKEEEWTGCPQG